MADHTKHLSPLLEQPALVLPNIRLNSTLNPELRYKTSPLHIQVSTCVYLIRPPCDAFAFAVPLHGFPLLDKGGQQRKSPSRAGANCACRARKKQRRRHVQQASLSTLLTHGTLIKHSADPGSVPRAPLIPADLLDSSFFVAPHLRHDIFEFISAAVGEQRLHRLFQAVDHTADRFLFFGRHVRSQPL